MSKDILKVVQRMNLQDVELQLALQCASLIAGLKISNMLNLPASDISKVKQILKKSHITYEVLVIREGKATLLLFDRKKLENYIERAEVRELLQKLGYEDTSFQDMIIRFQERYRRYAEEKCNFPHEVGLLLGYPVEDVKGFMINEGKNFLCVGYWKVYEKPEEKKRLFQQYEVAENTMIQMVSYGMHMVDIIDIYREKSNRCACV
ncbi:MAG: DUF3793 family protein [Lachnospiraceae bacterium]|nr:DUF3793 family protein [Lachnospiraceae bacterium]